MLFQTSRQTGRIPLVLVLGEEGAGKTRFLNLLLKHPVMAGSVVVGPTHAQGELLEGAPYIALPDVTTSVQESCLCCGMHSGLGDVLRKLFFEALSERSRTLNRVFIESRGVETGQLAFTLRHTPFLGQRYFHQRTFRLISASRLFVDGAKALVGLEPEHGRESQVLIISRQESFPSNCLVTNEQLSHVVQDVLQHLPYQQVLYLDAESIASGLGLG